MALLADRVMFGGKRNTPDLNALVEEIEYIAAAVAWLTRQQEAAMPTLHQIIDEIVQQRSVLNATLKLLTGLKGTFDEARADPHDVNGAMHRFSEMLDSGMAELAQAVVKAGEPHEDAEPVPVNVSEHISEQVAEFDDEEEAAEDEDEDEPDGSPDQPPKRRGSSHPPRRRK